MPRNVRGKLWRNITSLFRRRKRKYDVIAAANRETQPFEPIPGIYFQYASQLYTVKHVLSDHIKQDFFSPDMWLLIAAWK